MATSSLRGHRHRDRVVLPDGVDIVAASFDRRDPYRRDDGPPDLGLYLDAAWDPPWPHSRLVWPDFGVPRGHDTAITALAQLHQQSRDGATVELGCLGGHGRTGTALALLAVLAGVSPEEAVTWVRGAYCPRAVETRGQRRFVETMPRN